MLLNVLLHQATAAVAVATMAVAVEGNAGSGSAAAVGMLRDTGSTGAFCAAF